jgi:UPF0716 protein FxsA
LRFFDRAYVTRLFFVLLGLSVLLLADGYVLVMAASRYGLFMALGILASVGFAGMIVTLLAVDATLEHLRDRIRRGEYPSQEYAALASLVVAGLLLIIPGLFTDAIGVVLYTPPFRRVVGALIVRPLRGRLKEAYEHLKLEEFETR